MIVLALKLLIAHIIGDFVLQPNSWVEDKKVKKHKSKYLYFHIIIHLLLLLIFIKFEWPYFLSLIIIVVSHYIIDLLKLNFETAKNTRILFFIDQVLHITVLGLVVYLNSSHTFDIELFYTKKSLLLIAALLSVTFVVSILMKTIMSKWTLEENNSDNSLESAGKYIGILERLFVFGFIVLNQWAAIGLLVTVKSVFRFGDLSRAKSRKLTEYMLIGSLISFGFAITIGLIYNFILEII